MLVFDAQRYGSVFVKHFEFDNVNHINKIKFKFVKLKSWFWEL